MSTGVNGLGRIGSLVVREAANVEELSVVHLNDLMEPELAAHLLRYDSAHGPWHDAPEADEDGIGDMTYTRGRAPSEIPWRDVGVTHVLESSGRFTKRSAAAQHLDAGAQRVVISAPSPDADVTLVLGVNDEALENHP